MGATSPSRTKGCSEAGGANRFYFENAAPCASSAADVGELERVTLRRSMTAPAAKNRPVYEVRAGSVLASVWENTSEKGRHYNVTLTRLYKDGNSWKSSTSFSSWDLVDVARVAVVAEMWVNEKLAVASDERKGSAAS